MNQVLHFYFHTHVCFAWLFQFLFFRIIVVIKNSVGSFSMSMKSSLLHILSSKKVVLATGIFTWNVNMQFVCHKRGSSIPMLHCTELWTVQWDPILFKTDWFRCSPSQSASTLLVLKTWVKTVFFSFLPVWSVAWQLI